VTRRLPPRLVILVALGAGLLWAADPTSAATPASVLPESGAAEEEPAPPPLPDPAALEAGWWQSLAPGTEGLEKRVQDALNLVNERAADLPPERQGEIEPTLERLGANLRGYLRLSTRSADEPDRTSTLQETYSIDELLDVDRALRATRARFQADQAELDSRRRAVSTMTRRTDSLFAGYLDTPPRSPERLEAGIRVMSSRAGLLLEQEQVRLLTARIEVLRSRVGELEDELKAARAGLSFDEESEKKLGDEIASAEEALEKSRRRQREAEAGLIDIVATSDPDGAAVALARQEVRLRSVREALAEITLETLNTRADLITLTGDADDQTLADIGRRQSERADARDRIESRLGGWRESADQGLSESAQAIAGEADRQIMERRAVAAASTVSELQALRREIADLELLSELVSARVAERQGRMVGFFNSLGQRTADGWDSLRDIATSSIVTIGDTPITLAGIFRVLVILTIAFWFSRILRHALNRMASSRRTGMSPSSLYSLGRLLHYVIIIAGIIIGLSSIGLDFSNVALVASALSVGIGFGLQSVVSNFVSGLILLFERSLKVGDFVELDSGVTGMIREINVRSTLLNTNDNVDILVPNSEFVNGRLTNWTLREAVKRVHIPFGVAYGTDKDLTRKAALEAAERVPLTLKGPGREPQVWLVNFGDSSLDYELVVWLGPDSVRRPSAVHAAYLWEIETSLAEYGIEIPFPQRDLHLKSGMEALRRSEEDS
jgi:potassium efflux system protein